jgi:hypothetical protein
MHNVRRPIQKNLRLVAIKMQAKQDKTDSQKISSGILKIVFDRFIQSISGFELPTCLATFEQFQTLETNDALESLYLIATKKSSHLVIQTIFTLMKEVIQRDISGVTTEVYMKVKILAILLNALESKVPTPISAFIEKSGESLFIFKRQSGDVFEIKNIFSTLEEASTLYYKTVNHNEKQELKSYLARISKSVSSNIFALFKNVTGNNTSANYHSTLDIFSAFLKKILALKGIKMLLGESFITDLENCQKVIPNIQKVDELLRYDSPKFPPEKKMLEWLDSFSKMDCDFLQVRLPDAFMYYYQINRILMSKDILSIRFRNSAQAYFNRFKKLLSDYSQRFNFQTANANSVLLVVFSVVLLDPFVYESYKQEFKIHLQTRMSSIFNESPKSLYAYLYFCVTLLNHFDLFESKGLDVKAKAIQVLAQQIRTVQQIIDPCVKFLIKQELDRFFYYYIKKLPILSFEARSEKLPLLIQDAKELLSYLDNIQNLYDAFLEILQSAGSLSTTKNEILQGFEGRLSTEKQNAEQKLKFFEKAHQQQEWNKLAADMIRLTVRDFKLNACGYYQTIDRNGYMHNFCYQTRLSHLYKHHVQAFPNIHLSQPKNFVNMLIKVFEYQDVSRSPYLALVFIQGVVCQENDEYELALKFYNYCLENNLFEEPIKNYEGLYLVTRALIEKHVMQCKDALSEKKESMTKPLLTPSCTPSVFQQVPEICKSLPAVFLQQQVNAEPSFLL